MTTTRKSIIPLEPTDIGGIQPRAEELVTEEVIGYLSNININSALLSENDPLRDEYTKFLNDLGNSPIIITNEDIGIDEGGSYFDDIDLSSNITVESEGLTITKDYYTHNKLWANGVFGSINYPPCFASPLSKDRITKKILGEKQEFIRIMYDYEPQRITNINHLMLHK